MSAVASPYYTPPKKQNVVWQPNKGSQAAFLNCPFYEVLYHGTRGPGKSDALLMSFIRHVGNHGQAWRGIIFRRSENELAELQNKSQKWFYLLYGDKVHFHKQRMCWEWETGEKLYFRRILKANEYWVYHGHEYPFLGWDELTNWSTPDCYLSLMSCCRSSEAGVPRMIRATTNPYGPGHSWVKERFQLDGKYWETKVIDIESDEEKKRYGKNQKESPWFKKVAIHGHLSENTALMENNPKYASMLVQSASNPEMIKAWLEGTWDIVAGGMFADVWDPKFNIVTPFQIPGTWMLNRSFDWGSSAPFSVGWWAESDGSDYIDHDGYRHHTMKGDLFRIYEWYGAEKGKANTGIHMLTKDIAKGILDIERMLLLQGRFKAGPADSSIFDTIDGRSIADDMARLGVRWIRANKGPGSRKQGWLQMREMFKNAHGTGGREYPGLFVFNRCADFIRTIPVLPRDEKDLDDVDTSTEDHIADECRYRLHHPIRVMKASKVQGII